MPGAQYYGHAAGDDAGAGSVQTRTTRSSSLPSALPQYHRAGIGTSWHGGGGDGGGGRLGHDGVGFDGVAPGALHIARPLLPPRQELLSQSSQYDGEGVAREPLVSADEGGWDVGEGDSEHRQLQQPHHVSIRRSSRYATVPAGLHPGGGIDTIHEEAPGQASVPGSGALSVSTASCMESPLQLPPVSDALPPPMSPGWSVRPAAHSEAAAEAVPPLAWHSDGS